MHVRSATLLDEWVGCEHVPSKALPWAVHCDHLRSGSAGDPFVNIWRSWTALTVLQFPADNGREWTRPAQSRRPGAADRASSSPNTGRTATRRRWKRAEREVAAHLGGVRVPVNGRGYAPDVDHPLLGLEVNQTNSSPQRIEKAVCQAERASEWCRRKHGARSCLSP